MSRVPGCQDCTRTATCNSMRACSVPVRTRLDPLSGGDLRWTHKMRIHFSVASDPPVSSITDTNAMSSSTQDKSAMLETTAHKEREGGENIGEETPTIKGEDGASATPKDIRFWLIIMSLLVATFLSALDLTGIFIVCLVFTKS